MESSFFTQLSVSVHGHGLACSACLVATIWWWYRLQRIGPDGSSNDIGSCCNNPNCLRCHSSSRRHVETFRANATMLKRLAKLEPDMFDGMREGIWSAIEEKEMEFDRQNRQVQSGCFTGFTKWIKRLKSLQEVYSDATIKSSARKGAASSAMPLSPQQGQDPTVFLLPGLEAIPFHDASQCHHNSPSIRLWKSIPLNKNSPPIPVTGDIEALQRNWHIIRQELLEFVSNNQSSSDSFKPFDPKVYTHAGTASSQDDNTQQHNKRQPEWSSIYLYQQGIRQSEICNKYFPQTANLLETKCPHIMAGKCGFGSIYFSKLERNTKVKEHCGPTNIRWRCHLPLVVPENNGSQSSSCLRVGIPGVNETCVGWKEGVPILFDDSFLHSAVHQGIGIDGIDNSDFGMGGARIVLIIDFWHPSLTNSDRTALGVLYPPGS